MLTENDVTSFYASDGVNLYEIRKIIPNFGLAGGIILVVENAATAEIRNLSPVESAMCEPVHVDA